MIYDKLDLVIKLMDAKVAHDGYVDTRVPYVAFTSDVVYEYSFGQPFGILDDETKAEEWHDSLTSLKTTIPWARQFNWIITLSQKTPLFITRAISPQLARVAAMYYVSHAISCLLPPSFDYTES